MIIWINGAFGAGKTTLAAKLQRRMPDAISYDPEYLGDILTRWVPMPDSGDFQDLPALAEAGGPLRHRPDRRVPPDPDRSDDAGEPAVPR